jgi:hypothetical protein
VTIIVQYWVVKKRGGDLDISWRAQGPYNSRKAARKYRDAMINTALRLKELGANETFEILEKEIARSG